PATGSSAGSGPDLDSHTSPLGVRMEKSDSGRNPALHTGTCNRYTATQFTAFDRTIASLMEGPATTALFTTASLPGTPVALPSPNLAAALGAVAQRGDGDEGDREESRRRRLPDCAGDRAVPGGAPAGVEPHHPSRARRARGARRRGQR